MGNLNDPVLLAGVGMGNMLLNVLGFAIIQGMNGALESFVSQSFGAAKHEQSAIYLNRAKTMATIILIPIVVIYTVSDKILIKLHQEPSIAIISKHFVCLMIPGFWAQSMFDATRKYMSAQLEFMLPLYI